MKYVKPEEQADRPPYHDAYRNGEDDGLRRGHGEG
jgi:hypothetical protein